MAKSKSLPKPKKILPNKHSGRLIHHRHTSYVSLVVILLLMFFPLFIASTSLASAQSADPVTTSSGGYGVISQPAPSQAPTIRSVNDGQTYTSAGPIEVSGSCPDDTLVKLLKNQVFAGAAVCNDGTYTMTADLFVGANSLIARAYNSSEKVSPDSQPINVRLIIDGRGTASDPINPLGAPAGQLFLTSDRYHLGIKPGEIIKWPVSISGGQAPYAVNVSWGDGKTDLLSRGEGGKFEISHKYDKPGELRGSYKVVVNATDQLGNKTILQLVVVVGGDFASGALTGKSGRDISAIIRLGWQLLAVALLVVFSFWLGERREAHILKKRLGVA